MKNILIVDDNDELKQTIVQLKELNRVFVDRELRMAELKKRIAELEGRKDVSRRS